MQSSKVAETGTNSNNQRASKNNAALKLRRKPPMSSNIPKEKAKEMRPEKDNVVSTEEIVSKVSQDLGCEVIIY